MIIDNTSKVFYTLLCLVNEVDKYADNLAERVDPNTNMYYQLKRTAENNRELVNIIKQDNFDTEIVDKIGIGLSSFIEFCLEDSSRLTLFSQIMTEIKDKNITLRKLCKKLGYEIQ